MLLKSQHEEKQHETRLLMKLNNGRYTVPQISSVSQRIHKQHFMTNASRFPCVQEKKLWMVQLIRNRVAKYVSYAPFLAE